MRSAWTCCKKESLNHVGLNWRYLEFLVGHPESLVHENAVRLHGQECVAETQVDPLADAFRL